MYLLDAAVVVGLREALRGPGDPALAAWAERVPAQQMFLSALTIMELETAAAASIQRGKDIGAAWRHWLDRQLLPAFANRVLPLDAAVARRRAQLAYAGDREGLLAATALVHGLTLVTREPGRYRAGRVKALDPARIVIDDAESGDWREASRSGGAWLRNLLIR